MTKDMDQPAGHDHEAFLERAKQRPDVQETYDTPGAAHRIVRELVVARARAGLTQETVAHRMGTTKSAISRLEAGSKHVPSLGTLQRYADAVGCDLRIELVPREG